MNNILAILMLTLLLPSTPALSETAEDKGLALATEADKRDTGFGDSVATLEMTLTNRNGDVSKRDMRSKTLEVTGDGDKSLVIFDRPRDIKGTALLTFTHKSGPDDQWLYLPALKRVKRISSNNKSGPFMGSEFAYEDLSSQEVEKYTYKYIKDDVLDGAPMFVFERYPVDKKSGYKRQIVWMDKDEYRNRKIDYYDRKNALLKTLNFSGYKQYLDKFWRAEKMYMENHQTGKTTLLTWKDYKFRSGLTDRSFDKNSLKRAK